MNQLRQARLAQLRRDLAMTFEIPARDLIASAAIDLGITTKDVYRLLAANLGDSNA